MRYLTAGESHGKRLTAILDGFPAGLKIDIGEINLDLSRRQHGYGRGDRMKIEKDRVEFTSGIRNGMTLGSPITLNVNNKDWENWVEIMTPNPEEFTKGLREIKTPRPGHADLTGGIKYNHHDLRNILERASARETAVRVAVGGICKEFLKLFKINIRSHVTEIGGVQVTNDAINLQDEETFSIIESSPVRTFDKDIEALMIKVIDRAKLDGDSLGGVFEVVASNVPIGLGSHTQWDKKLDARLSMAMMSIQAIKGVEIGLGFKTASRVGSQVHDEIEYSDKRFSRKTNNAGGIEGGISNGENIIIRAAMKPIATLYTPLNTVNIESKEIKQASVERSDNCAVPAASIVGETVVAIELARQMNDKFGGDSVDEIMNNYNQYLKQVEDY